MTKKTKVSLMLLGECGQVHGNEVELHYIPREGEFIEHEVDNKSRLYRVVAIVQPSNPVSDGTTMDVYVTDEGPLGEALRKLEVEKRAVMPIARRIELANQFKILAALYPNEADSYDVSREALERGYEFFCHDLHRNFGTPMSSKDSQFVFSVLDMYQSFADYIQANPTDAEVTDHYWVRFLGFDGNSEGNEYGFAQFLVQDKGYYGTLRPQFEKHQGNSHMPCVSRYRRMLANWDEPGKLRDRILRALTAD